MLGELPPIIASQIKGRLSQDMPKFLRYEEDGIVVWGRPDDYLDLEDGATVVYDHKTRAEPPTEIHPSYRLQMDVYSYLLQMNNFRTTNKALIGYYFPADCDLHNGLPISCKVVEVTTNPKEVKILLARARNILDGSIPASAENCKYCQWGDQIIHME